LLDSLLQEIPYFGRNTNTVMNVEDEVLIEDSDDDSDLVIRKSRRRSLRSHGKSSNISSNKSLDVDDEFDFGSPQRIKQGNSRSGKKITSAFESKIKDILNKSGTKLTRSDSAPASAQVTPKANQNQRKKTWRWLERC